MRYRRFAVLLLFALGVPLAATAETGKVVKVVDGDTFMAEIEGKSGPETIEVHLRCADAPIASSPFGDKSSEYLQQLLGQQASVNYKVQAYCGSDKCVEALAYFPPPEEQPVSYINTQMIAAGLARNSGCRGEFADAEEQARTAKIGIWSTGETIVYSEAKKQVTVKTASTPASTSSKVSSATEQEAPAIIRYDRAERKVTIISRKISLTRAVEIIDAVSPSPIKVYLQEEEYLAINLENANWYDALRYIVETADLKQVNLDGKIDLYTRLFYYKHVSPYLKVAGNVGVYMNTGSAPRSEPAVDDGTTRYVFINDFENSAEVAQQYRETKARTEDSIDKSSGFIQVHEQSGPAPVSDYGRFELSNQKSEPVKTAAVVPEEKIETKPVVEEKKTAPAVVAEPAKPVRAPLQPYSGERPVVKEEAPAPAAAPPQPVAVAPAAPPEKVASAAPAPTAEVAKTPAAAPAKDQTPAKATDTSKAAPAPADETAAVGPEVELEFSWLHAVAIVFILLVVIIGCMFLTRSAGAKAAAAERHVEPEELEEEEDDLPLDVDAQVDKQYEEEIFEELDQAVDRNAVEAEAAPEVKPKSKRGPKPLSGKDKRINPAIVEEEVAAPATGYDADEHGPERVPRKICLLEVKCSIDGNSFTGIGLDISNGGLFIDSKESLDIGKVVELEFKLFEDDKNNIRCRGAVTWYNRRPDPIKPDYPNGFGVRFVDLEVLTVQRINEYLALDDE